MLFGIGFSAVLAAILFWGLIALTAIDWETGYLPDAITLPLIAMGLIANIGDRFASFPDALIGAAAGYGAFRLIAWGFERLRGIEGLGQGDAKLLAAIGAWAGWTALAPTVFVAALLGLAGVAIAHLHGHKMAAQTPIAFGPALAAAGAIVFTVFTSSGVPSLIR